MGQKMKGAAPSELYVRGIVLMGDDRWESLPMPGPTPLFNVIGMSRKGMSKVER